MMIALRDLQGDLLLQPKLLQPKLLRCWGARGSRR
jgi:hypothetical protein